MQHLKLIHATLQGNEENYVLCMSRDAGAGGQGSNCIPPPLPPPQVFGRLVHPILRTLGADYVWHITTAPRPPI